MTQLASGMTYYVRAYAVNGQGVVYGEEISFTTTVNKPEVTTTQVSNITQTTALGGGNVTSSGGATVTERGICWSTNHSPTLNDSHVASGAGLGIFSAPMTGLATGTIYYVRAYATNSQGTSYGNELSFTTIANSPTVTTAQVSNVTQTSALGGGNVISDGGATVTERGICWSTSHNPTVSGNHVSSGSGMGAFTAEMTGLASNTTYYVRAYAINSAGFSYGAEVSFTTTQGISSPTVTTSQVTNIMQTTATGGGVVTTDGGALVTERGVCWSTLHAPSVNGSHASSGSGEGSYTVQMTGLTPNTTYYIRAYAINSAGTSYGNELQFTTAPELPSVTTAQVSNINQTSALGGGNVIDDGGATVTERGICWSTSHNPTLSGNHVSSGSGMGAFTAEMAGLASNTKYYVRAYATNSTGTAYGNEVSFTTTQEISAPVVTTASVTNITSTTAKGGGNVTSDGGATVTERGLCWSMEHNPTTNDLHESVGSGLGAFELEIVDLQPNTTYYVRAYAINSVGTSYGAEISFTTLQNLSAPTVMTAQVTNITQTTALGGGNVTSDGGASVTERGICWSTSHNPTTAGNHANSGSGTGSYTVSMTGLTTNTTYYVRAYAINSQGTSYGEEVSFTTAQSISAPSVITSQVTSITQTTALGGGNVTDDGGASVTQRGICWSMSPNPTVNDSHEANGTGTGNYTVSMTGLMANTTYYVRAYAINSVGTSYGNEESFTTLASLPTVTTSPMADITQTSALGGGNVTTDGGSAVTDRGLCWSTSHDPTTSNSHVSSGTGTGSFTASITGLTASTTYYVRAYATNSVGTSYGEEMSFTTLDEIFAPTVTTSPVSDITQTSASGGGNVTDDGGAAVTERGLCWSTTHNPTTSNSHVNSGSGLGSFTVSITGLTDNMTYYVRAYAINSVGTSYGEEVSFTTLTSNVPNGAVNGIFSISASQQVYFSRGNLQYRASTDTWRFAEHQYDVVGQSNMNVSATYSGWIDLFGWGTSGYNHGALSYQPWSTSEVNGHYRAYGSSTADLNDQTGQADWGYNAISNGGNQTNQWRTLTKDEWTYVFNTRNTTSGIRYAKATVNEVKGVILLPDNWNAAIYPLSNVNTYTAHFSDNVVSASNWNMMEAAGAVFMPSAGGRVGTNISGVSQPDSSTAYGRYWSTTHSDNESAYFLSISNASLSPSFIQDRYIGQSVRVVCPVER
jgi:FlaG/FlaF family flagellin (archaellin)